MRRYEIDGVWYQFPEGVEITGAKIKAELPEWVSGSGLYRKNDDVDDLINDFDTIDQLGSNKFYTIPPCMG